MEFLNQYWGINDNISPLELSARAFVMFVLCFIMIRWSGMRPFKSHNAFDTVIVFLIGGIVSRGIVGATPFFSTVAGALVIVVINKLMAMLTCRYDAMENLFKGHSRAIYKNGKFNYENMRNHEVTEKEVLESLRIECQIDSLESIREVIMEKTGDISFVKKQQ